MNKFLIIISLLFLQFISFAQNVNLQPTIEPEFFSADEQITITYNVTGTSLSSLDDAYMWMWLPNNSTTDAPSNINPADSDPEATAQAKLQKLNENGQTLFRISLTPTLFYNQSADDITEIGMLLKGNDWSDGQSTDFTVEISQGFSVNISSPFGNYGFYEADDIINVELSSSENSTFEFFVDGILEYQESGITQFSFEHTVIDDGVAHDLIMKVNNGTDSEAFNYSYIVNPVVSNEPLPAGLQDGINYGDDATTVHLVLTAPNKENVFLIGTFNNWSLSDQYLMKKDGDQFWLEVSALIPGEEYQFQYLVDGEITIADPYAEKIGSEYDDPEIIRDNRYPELMPYPSGKTSHAVSYLQTNKTQFDWTDSDFQRPANEDLVIYELLIRDFTELRTYKAVTDRLDYLEDLGINAIQFMPVMEFEGNLSWGYNPYSMLALDKFYGTEYDFKTLVNEAHSRGMAIILDIALNHQFGRNSLARLYNEGDYGNPTSQNPWFNTSPRHDFNVGYDMNHESQYTQDYVDRVVAYWLEEYHVDGYRYDLSKGFTQKSTLGNVGAWGQYDASRVALLKRMADEQWSVDPDSYVILEHFAENTEEKELAEYGMMLWGNENHNFRNLAKGNSANVSGLSYQVKGWNEPHVIGYMESHDEERVAWDLKNSSSQNLAQQMQRLKLNAALFFLVPGPKMIWQFGEFGYDEELNNDRLGVKPTRWEYLDDPERNKLFQVYQSLIKLKTSTDYLNKDNFQWSGSGDLKWARYNNDDVKIVMMGNFSKSTQTFDQQILQAGTWYNYLTGQEVEIESEVAINLISGEFRILTSEPIENYIDEQAQSDIVLAERPIQTITKTKLFPNPTQNRIYIESAEQIKQILLKDLNGKSIPIQVEKIENRIALDLSSLQSGIYMLNYLEQGIQKQHRILKF
ncbi:Por secretion system C-terminal sorting domain-containing protein [Marivirga sericea]|uniref:Por secretion system C-terminal sorting domain-containing protein n=1 Tax=Marivirga sericea TaxID=1028 RepID=A0A1X7IT22_9BACT|nr:alpha-amylase family glycosyl hydrolase [Marivirga sericea]SMG18022.1 Por secretion system C-terminal sorting domain-containing protein [Marivirga sericea]